MMFPTFRRKKVWIPALAAAVLGIAGWLWPSRGPGYADPSQIPFTEGAPSAASLRAAPFYGTRVRFVDSAPEAFARAQEENKLVLVLHLSGRFGSSETT